MGEVAAFPAVQQIVIDIGGLPIAVRSESLEFLRMLETRYSGFLSPEALPVFELEVDLVAPRRITQEEDVAVRFEAMRWLVERNDLQAEWDPALRRGRIIQSANPYSLDTALRILHSLMLAGEGGLLMHAASAIRDGRAFLFAGVSGAGKTTISRLAPSGTTLLTDEISYLRPTEGGYVAHGTPFAGELAQLGENIKAPLAAIYLLQKGPRNTIERHTDSEAVRSILKNVLLFAKDPDVVGAVFETVCKLVSQIPVYRLTFLPDERVWELIV